MFNKAPLGRLTIIRAYHEKGISLCSLKFFCKVHGLTGIKNYLSYNDWNLPSNFALNKIKELNSFI